MVLHFVVQLEQDLRFGLCLLNVHFTGLSLFNGFSWSVDPINEVLFD